MLKHTLCSVCLDVQEQVGKLREEREVMSRDLAVLRADLDNTRGERERLLADNTRLKSEYDRIK